MHLLIIEDEEALCLSIAEGLRMNGYETDTCFDGEEGLELCMTEKYDLILLDENLALWAAFKGTKPDIPALKEAVDELCHILTQKTAGQRKDRKSAA